MRIVGGAWRGRRLTAPPGQGTRPTADRVRQALFDVLLHAPWCGRDGLEGAHVLDAFAGTGALGLEALSRGAASACFIEHDPAALRALRSNIATCGAGGRATVLPVDLLTLRQPRSGSPAATLLFLDPPYGRDLHAQALAQVAAAGLAAAGALAVVETGEAETWRPPTPLLAERRHGAARLVIFRLP
jgi:16S rRNA (guanine966-N2)-methyltransferase